MRNIALLLLSTSAMSQAALLPTEVYYNGPLAGADPDEFLELTNASADPVAVGSPSPTTTAPPGRGRPTAPVPA